MPHLLADAATLVTAAKAFRFCVSLRLGDSGAEVDSEVSRRLNSPLVMDPVWLRRESFAEAADE